MHFIRDDGRSTSLAVAESHKTHGIGRLIVDSLIYEAKLYGSMRFSRSPTFRDSSPGLDSMK